MCRMGNTGFCYRLLPTLNSSRLQHAPAQTGIEPRLNSILMVFLVVSRDGCVK